MLEATRRKLRQAQFFYQHLINERKRTSPYSLEAFNLEAFRCYVAAFILVARSVLLVLHYEEKEKWEAWEPGWKSRLTDEERKLLRFTNELRIDEAKRAGADTLVEWEEIAIHELLSANFDLQRQHPAYGAHVFAPPGTPSPKIRRPAYYFENEEGKEEVTALCQRYLGFLEKAVEDFCKDTSSASPK
jgi:hypothetical protein